MIKKWINKLFNCIKISGIPFFIGFFGAYSGSEGTSLLWRRAGIPLIFALHAWHVLHSVWVILLMSIWGWLSIGYGVPDETDSGSTVGRFWYKIFKGNHKLTDIFTRGTVGLGISLSFCIIPILNHNYLNYFLGCLGIILIYAFNSWRGYGQYIFEYKNKKYYLCKVDIITYTILGICGLFIIGK
jgi:hypothetical protein